MTDSNRQVSFSASPVPLVGLVAFVTAVAGLSVVTHYRLLGPDLEAYPDHVSALLSLPFFAAMLVGTVAVMRYEGVSLADVGVDRASALPGVVAFACFWVGVAAAGVGYLLATGAGGEVGFAFDLPWWGVLVWFLLTLTVSNGLTEELVFRGYVQNKCAALAAGGSRVPPDAVGVVAAALLFGVPHLPLAFVFFDVSWAGVPSVILENLLPGVLYGLLYYLTRNLWLVGLLHGFGNAPVVPFDPAAVPSFRLLAIVVGVAVAVGYRRWAASRDGLTVRASLATAPSG
jgi:membrane protease YdiL (CAAX protease family)